MAGLLAQKRCVDRVVSKSRSRHKARIYLVSASRTCPQENCLTWCFGFRGRAMKEVLILLVSVAIFAMITLQAQETAASDDRAVATFAGGCFWCMEPPYDKLDAVIATVSGYTGGGGGKPTYEQVPAG